MKEKLHVFILFIPLAILFIILLLNLPLAEKVEDKLKENLTVEEVLRSFSADKLQKLKFQVDESSIVFDPWLNGFPYRRAITISNSGSALTDYQVNITVDTASLISAGKMQAYCNDTRFTDSDGSTLLNYWIESGCNTTSTKIWVKVPSIPASSTKTIYVYYGNPSANSTSDAKKTFLFYDDFTSLNTSVWGNDTWTETSGTTHIVDISPAGYLRVYIKTGCYGTGCNGVTLASTKNIAQFDFSQGILIDYDWYWASGGTPSYQGLSGNGLLLSTTIDIDQGNGLAASSSTSDWIGFLWDPYNNGARTYGFYKMIAGTKTNFANSTGWPSSTVYKFRWIINATHVKFYTNRSATPFYSGSHGLSDTTGWFFVQMADASGYYQSQHLDFLIIRKFVDPEPTTSIGGEIENSIFSAIQPGQIVNVSWLVKANQPGSYKLNFITVSPFNTIQSNSTDFTVIKVISSDTQPPTYSLNSTNSTIAGTRVSHNLYWQDNVGLSHAIFSFDNCTGSFQNVSEMDLSGTSAWSNFTVVINETAGCTIRWCVYANDTSNNWNGTSCASPFSYTTTSPVYIAITLSSDLAGGIRFESLDLGSNNVSSTTCNNLQCNITVSSDTTVNVDIVAKVNSYLTRQGGTETISTQYWNSSSAQQPSSPAYQVQNIYDYTNKVGSNLAPGTNVVFNTWLTIPSGQASGVYNNTIYFCADEYGTQNC